MCSIGVVLVLYRCSVCIVNSQVVQKSLEDQENQEDPVEEKQAMRRASKTTALSSDMLTIRVVDTGLLLQSKTDTIAKGIKAGTERLKNSFYLKTIRLLNSNSHH